MRPYVHCSIIYGGEDTETTIEDWLKKMWYLYTVGYYPAIRECGIRPFATTWMDLENIILSEINQSKKAMNHKVSLICWI